MKFGEKIANLVHFSMNGSEEFLENFSLKKILIPAVQPITAINKTIDSFTNMLWRLIMTFFKANWEQAI